MRIAIVLHLGNVGLWEDIWTKMKFMRFVERHKLQWFITFLPSSTRPNFMNTLKKCIPSDSIVLEHPNYGMDVGGFFHIYPLVHETHPDLVLKIHTKSDTAWRNRLFTSLVGSPDRIEHIISLFQSDSNIGVVTGQGLLYQKDQYNTPLVQTMATEYFQTKVPYNWQFPVCTMFWIRWSCISNLDHAKETKRLKRETGYFVNTKPTCTHSWERLFGISCLAQGYRLVGLPENIHAWKEYLNKYKDLRDAGITGEAQAWRHWMAHGKNERRYWPND